MLLNTHYFHRLNLSLLLFWHKWFNFGKNLLVLLRALLLWLQLYFGRLVHSGLLFNLLLSDRLEVATRLV